MERIEHNDLTECIRSFFGNHAGTFWKWQLVEIMSTTLWNTWILLWVDFLLYHHDFQSLPATYSLLFWLSYIFFVVYVVLDCMFESCERKTIIWLIWLYNIFIQLSLSHLLILYTYVLLFMSLMSSILSEYIKCILVLLTELVFLTFKTWGLALYSRNQFVVDPRFRQILF